MKTKKLLLIAALAIATIIALGLALTLLVQKPDSTTAGKIKIKDFRKAKEITCAALTPGCGYCPGEIKGGACFVTQAEFDEYKQLYSGLEAE